MYLGLWVWHSRPGSWMRESGILDTWHGKAFAAFCTVFELAAGLQRFGSHLILPLSNWTSFAAASFVGRTKAEDRILEDHFGSEWRAWAQRVPYRLIPYVY